MPLSRKKMHQIAKLCRIGMTENDLERMRVDLSHILETFHILEELDNNIAPHASHSMTMEMVTRPDEPRISCNMEDVLCNAPLREGNLIRVKAVLEE